MPDFMYMTVRQDLVLPTFLVVGSMKSGTSALHDWIGRHPDAMTSSEKELNYFSLPDLHEHGIEGYARHFSHAREAIARGESSPTYAMWPMRPEVPERISEVLPEVRILYCVRDPIERMRSNYLHAYAKGIERRPIGKALIEDPRYLLISSYAQQLDRYLAHFAREQVLVLPSETMGRHVDRICRHLGLAASSMPSLKRVHETSDKVRLRSWATGPLGRVPVVRRCGRTPITASDGVLPPEVRATLVTRLRPDLQRLQPWLPDSHDAWGLLG